ncbi:hypothetical protein WPS_13110 [Vulcanimicrobium alpinum]|uniref:Uncharacterized protein n=1 Tax=Vulcanimicrobium alpinum TaxID=3016050 RepID=A0AAN1XV79_UNVUL|nr:flagellar biosynthetic protein FliO [Vulcanimicrobium alpinum]BDE06035.1 hypothetical protein WPS_13110 [Vulcanimicrobium alpinum]
MTSAVRLLHRRRLVASTGKRLVTVVESTFLAPNVTVHVMKVGDRYYLVGAGSAGLTRIDDVEGEVVEAYIRSQRMALAGQDEAVARLMQRFRKEP